MLSVLCAFMASLANGATVLKLDGLERRILTQCRLRHVSHFDGISTEDLICVATSFAGIVASEPNSVRRSVKGLLRREEMAAQKSSANPHFFRLDVVCPVLCGIGVAIEPQRWPVITETLRRGLQTSISELAADEPEPQHQVYIQPRQSTSTPWFSHQSKIELLRLESQLSNASGPMWHVFA